MNAVVVTVGRRQARHLSRRADERRNSLALARERDTGPHPVARLRAREGRLGMRHLVVCALAGPLVLLAAGASAQAPATGRVDVGKREFEAKCAVCHGTGGKGNGPVVELLKKSPPDLTVLARQNGGVFPMERLYRVIEGSEVAAHGTRDMPIWGRDYRLQAGEYYMDQVYDPDAYVRARILALLEYINRLQVK